MKNLTTRLLNVALPVINTESLGLLFAAQRAAARLAKANDLKYLQSINLQALQKDRGKPAPGENPRDFYMKLQQDALQGPIFSNATLDFFERLEIDLQKDEIKWLATRLQKKARIDINTLPSVLDYVRAEKPNLLTLSYKKALVASELWHRQFKVKTKPSGGYATHKVVHKFADGYAIVKLGPKDCKTEGELMGHCVGGYAAKVVKGICNIFSLRDYNNAPHVTIEFTSKGKIAQIQGKQNRDPVAKYHKYIGEWFDALKLPLDIDTVHYSTNTEKVNKFILDAARIKNATNINASSRLRKGLQNPRVSAETLKKVYESNDSSWAKAGLINHPNTPETIKSKLLSSIKDDDTLYYIAKSPLATSEILHFVVTHKKVDADALCNVIDNANTSTDTLDYIVDKKCNDAMVVQHIFESSRLPEAALLPLIKKYFAIKHKGSSFDPNHVADSLIDSNRMTVEVANYMLDHVKDAGFICDWPDMPPEMQKKIWAKHKRDQRAYIVGRMLSVVKEMDPNVAMSAAKSGSYHHIMCLLDNPAAPRDVLVYLSKHKDDLAISRGALKALKEKN